MFPDICPTTRSSYLTNSLDESEFLLLHCPEAARVQVFTPIMASSRARKGKSANRFATY